MGELQQFGERFGFDGRNEFGHKGFLTRVQCLYQDLLDQGTLKEVMLKNCDYTLRVTGHSLGAACAAFLAIMLKPMYPGLKCLCYCPPGCCMTAGVATYCEQFVLSFIHNTDLVPRLSHQN